MLQVTEFRPCTSIRQILNTNVALRSGPSGMVQLALNRETREQVAIKFLLRGNTFNAPSIVRELQNHRLCHLHPHIVPLRVRGHARTSGA